MEPEHLVIRRAIDGDEGALRTLWTRHAPHIDAIVRRLVVVDEGEVELQEAEGGGLDAVVRLRPALES